MRIDEPGVYVTEGGNAVQITGIGKFVVAGFINKTDVRVWCRKTGTLGGRITKDRDKWKIVRRPFK